MLEALCAEGWRNFRMRAMLVSFASHHLWLDRPHEMPALVQQMTGLGIGRDYPAPSDARRPARFRTIRPAHS